LKTHIEGRIQKALFRNDKEYLKEIISHIDICQKGKDESEKIVLMECKRKAEVNVKKISEKENIMGYFEKIKNMKSVKELEEVQKRISHILDDFKEDLELRSLQELSINRYKEIIEVEKLEKTIADSLLEQTKFYFVETSKEDYYNQRKEFIQKLTDLKLENSIFYLILIIWNIIYENSIKLEKSVLYITYYRLLIIKLKLLNIDTQSQSVKAYDKIQQKNDIPNDSIYLQNELKDEDQKKLIAFLTNYSTQQVDLFENCERNNDEFSLLLREHQIDQIKANLNKKWDKKLFPESLKRITDILDLIDKNEYFLHLLNDNEYDIVKNREESLDLLLSGYNTPPEKFFLMIRDREPSLFYSEHRRSLFLVKEILEENNHSNLFEDRLPPKVERKYTFKHLDKKATVSSIIEKVQPIIEVKKEELKVMEPLKEVSISIKDQKAVKLREEEENTKKEIERKRLEDEYKKEIESQLQIKQKKENEMKEILQTSTNIFKNPMIEKINIKNLKYESLRNDIDSLKQEIQSYFDDLEETKSYTYKEIGDENNRISDSSDYIRKKLFPILQFIFEYNFKFTKINESYNHYWDFIAESIEEKEIKECIEKVEGMINMQSLLFQDIDNLKNVKFRVLICLLLKYVKFY
jgi:hypothetical protein